MKTDKQEAEKKEEEETIKKKKKRGKGEKEDKLKISRRTNIRKVSTVMTRRERNKCVCKTIYLRAMSSPNIFITMKAENTANYHPPSQHPLQTQEQQHKETKFRRLGNPWQQ